MIDKIVSLLMSVGLRRDTSKQLADKINRMYEELEREKQRERGRKGALSGKRMRDKSGKFTKGIDKS